MISFTLWPSANSSAPAKTRQAKWCDFVAWLDQVPEFPTKLDCGLLKLATFGDKPSLKEGKITSYRNNANVREIHGIECDYDAEKISPEEACQRLEAKKLRATIYTSYNHSGAAPRWRALVPLAHSIEPKGRLAFAEALNGIFDGTLGSESAVLSQSYFFGRNPKGDYRVLTTFDDPEEGFCIDELDDWPTWRVPFPKNDKTDNEFRSVEENETLADQALSSLLSGEDVHGTTLHLVGRWVAKGLSDAEIRQIMETLAIKVGEARGTDRVDALMGGELDRMIAGARGKGYTPPSADISVLMSQFEARKEQKPPKQPLHTPMEQAVPERLLRIPGVLGLGVDWLLKNSKKPQPIYATQAMLGLGATVLGRRYRTDQDNWPSLFLPVLGLSATGKEAIKYGIETILTEAGLDSLIGPSKYTSDSGLLSSLIHQPSHICVSDEFGKILASASDPGNIGMRSMLRMMMEVWGRVDGVLRPVGYATAGLNQDAIDKLNARIVYKPALTFVGLSTPDAFYDALTRGALADGFVNRQLIVECKESRKPSIFQPKTAKPEPLIQWCKDLAPTGFMVNGQFAEIADDSAREPSNVTVVPFSDAAMERVRQFDAWCIEQMNELQAEGLAELYGRTNEISMRVALIVALSCESRTIELEHLDWAIAYVSYWTRETIQSARFRISDGDMDAAMKDVERLLKEKADGLTMRELRQRSRKFAALAPRQQIDVMQSLQADQVASMVKIKTKTRTRDTWFYSGEPGEQA